MARVSAAAAALGLLLSAAAVRAQSPPPIALEWHAPVGCPNEREVLDRIHALSPDWPPNGPPLQAAASIVRADGRFHLELRVRSEGSVGERNIDGKTCESLASAVAIHLALVLRDRASAHEARAANGDPAQTRAAEQATLASAPEVAAAAAVKSAMPARVADENTAEEREGDSARRWHVLLQLPLAAAQVGPLPLPSAGLALGVGASIDAWQVLLQAFGWLAQTLHHPDRPSLGASVNRLSVSSRACREMLSGDFGLAPCLSLKLEHVWARGTGNHVAARVDTATWLATGLGIQGRVRVAAHVNLIAAADADVQTSRPELSIGGAGSLGRLGRAAVSIALGVEWIF